MASSVDFSDTTYLLEVLGRYRPIDLSHTLEVSMPTFPTHPKYFQMPWIAYDDPAELHQLIMGEHTGTHVDSPRHLRRRENSSTVSIDEIEITTLIGRAVTITLGPFDANNALVGSKAIREWELEHVPIEAGDIVLLDYQWATRRWKPVPEGFDLIQGWPGLARDAVEYLIEKRVKAVGTDCISGDSGDGGMGELPAHYLFLERGILILENVTNMSNLPPVSVFIAFPLKIRNGTGSPLRAVAFVPDR